MAQDRRPARGRAPRERADPRDQLGEPERLGQVVVGADRQPLDEVLECPRRGQHQDPGLRPLAADRAAHVVAVEARQVAVEHEHVVADDPRLDQRVGSVRREVDGHPLPPQPARDRIGQPPFVLCDQHAHLRSSG